MTVSVADLTGKGNYFEDFAVGDVYEHVRGKTVEGLENVLITNLVLNTAQAHFNEHHAEKLAQGHRIVFGGVTASIVIGLAMQDTGENAVEEVGLDKVRFRVPVLHGDTLYAFTEVVAKDAEPADPRGHREVGLVHFRHWGLNQRDEIVFEAERRTLIKKQSFTIDGVARDNQAAAPAPLARRRSAKASRRVVKRAAPAAAKLPRSLKAAKVKPKAGRKKRGR